MTYGFHRGIPNPFTSNDLDDPSDIVCASRTAPVRGGTSGGCMSSSVFIDWKQLAAEERDRCLRLQQDFVETRAYARRLARRCAATQAVTGARIGVPLVVTPGIEEGSGALAEQLGALRARLTEVEEQLDSAARGFARERAAARPARQAAAPPARPSSTAAGNSPRGASGRTRAGGPRPRRQPSGPEPRRPNARRRPRSPAPPNWPRRCPAVPRRCTARPARYWPAHPVPRTPSRGSPRRAGRRSAPHAPGRRPRCCASGSRW